MFRSKRVFTAASVSLLPSVVALLIFVYGFISWTIRVSFSAWTGVVPDFTFAGLSNYISMFTSQRFQIDLFNTLFFTLFFLLVSVILGLLLAIMLDRKLKGESIFRNIFLFPMAISFVVTGVAWRWIFNPGMEGSPAGINILLTKLGMSALTWGWYTQPFEFLHFHVALIPVVIAASWQLTGYTMAMYLAGLTGIPLEIKEAARMDGASEFKMYRYVIIPMIRPITLSVLIVLGHISLKIFDLVYTMTGSGPGFATDVPGINMFEKTFRGNRYGEGAAISVVMFMLIACVIIPYLYNSLKKERS
jgi:glucose/mannose transport system permease protein